MNTADIPGWFDLANYSVAVRLPPEGWYHQLAIRRELASELIFSPGPSEQASRDQSSISELDDFQHVSDALAALQRGPIDNWVLSSPPDENDENPLAWFAWQAKKRFLLDRIFFQSGVRSLTVSDIYDAEKRLLPNYRVYARGYAGVPFSGDQKWAMQNDYPWVQWLHEPASRYSEVDPSRELLAADLTQPDRVLKKSFAAWLKKVRSQDGSSDHRPARQTPAFSEFVTVGILPYLDLVLWQRQTGVRLTNQQIADYIYDPKENSSDQRVIEVTKPKAEHFWSAAGLREIAVLAIDQD